MREKSRKNALILDNIESAARRGMPGWLDFDKGNFKGSVVENSNRDEITMPIQEQLIVELYSK